MFRPDLEAFLGFTVMFISIFVAFVAGDYRGFLGIVGGIFWMGWAGMHMSLLTRKNVPLPRLSGTKQIKLRGETAAGFHEAALWISRNPVEAKTSIHDTCTVLGIRHMTAHSCILLIDSLTVTSEYLSRRSKKVGMALVDQDIYEMLILITRAVRACK